MSTTDIFILIAASVAITLAWGNLRNMAWVAVVVANFFLSGLYWRAGYAAPATITGLLDFAVGVAIFMFGKYRWELWLMALSLLSVGASLVFVLMSEAEQYYLPYSFTLEAITFIFITLAGGTAAWQKAGFTDATAFNPWRTVFGFVRPVYRQTKSDRR